MISEGTTLDIDQLLVMTFTTQPRQDAGADRSGRGAEAEGAA